MPKGWVGSGSDNARGRPGLSTDENLIEANFSYVHSIKNSGAFFIPAPRILLA